MSMDVFRGHKKIMDMFGLVTLLEWSDRSTKRLPNKRNLPVTGIYVHCFLVSPEDINITYYLLYYLSSVLLVAYFYL